MLVFELLETVAVNAVEAPIRTVAVVGETTTDVVAGGGGGGGGGSDEAGCEVIPEHPDITATTSTSKNPGTILCFFSLPHIKPLNAATHAAGMLRTPRPKWRSKVGGL